MGCWGVAECKEHRLLRRLISGERKGEKYILPSLSVFCNTENKTNKQIRLVNQSSVVTGLGLQPLLSGDRRIRSSM